MLKKRHEYAPSTAYKKGNIHFISGIVDGQQSHAAPMPLAKNPALTLYANKEGGEK
ncbi:hypothetical protein G6554_19670 [Bacillus sp. MM2020_4]|nr:hypothetical protein [Bacillus sp. MM2020_4]